MYHLWIRHQQNKQKKRSYYTRPKANKTYKIIACVSHFFFILINNLHLNMFNKCFLCVDFTPLKI